MKNMLFSMVLCSVALPVFANSGVQAPLEVPAGKGFGGFSLGGVVGGSWGSDSIEGKLADGANQFLQGIAGRPLPKISHHGMLGGLNLGYGHQLKNLYMGVDLNILLSGRKTDLKEYFFALAENVLERIEEDAALEIQKIFNGAELEDYIVEFSAKQRAFFDFGVKFGYVWNNKILFGVKVGPTLSLYQTKQHLKNEEAHSQNASVWGFTGGLFGAYKLSEKTSLSLNLDYRITKTPIADADYIRVKMKSFSVMAGWHYHF